MDFAFTLEQEAVRETTRRFAAERLAPQYQRRENEGRLDRDLVREMGSLGLIGVDLPAELGGVGQSSVTCGIVVEEVARGDFNVSYVQVLGSLVGSVVAAHAPRKLARKIVSRICSGEILIALGLTEPGAGSDAAHLAMKARREGKGYRLDGEKTSISLAEQADEIVVLARTGEPSDGASGVSAFLVPMSAPGVTTSHFEDVGTRVVGRGSVFFENVAVPEERRLGQEGQGFRQVMRGFDYSRALIGLECIGPARASLEETWRYITERRAFGNPIARYQGVTEPLSEAETLLTAAQLLCYRALWLRDEGHPHTSEAAMCKWWAPQVAFDTIHQCLLLHGHNGYSSELPHQQRLRDVLGLQIGDGTAQIQKMIIAREKVGRVAVPYA
ncbi:MAG: acyl-CoA dehydrogenase family protein [Planctomycetota bacterium]|jgi:cyclohexanecarboxyl-CoA dehydrogenase